MKLKNILNTIINETYAVETRDILITVEDNYKELSPGWKFEVDWYGQSVPVWNKKYVTDFDLGMSNAPRLPIVPDSKYKGADAISIGHVWISWIDTKNANKGMQLSIGDFRGYDSNGNRSHTNIHHNDFLIKIKPNFTGNSKTDAAIYVSAADTLLKKFIKKLPKLRK